MCSYTPSLPDPAVWPDLLHSGCMAMQWLVVRHTLDTALQWTTDLELEHRRSSFQSTQIPSWLWTFLQLTATKVLQFEIHALTKQSVVVVYVCLGVVYRVLFCHNFSIDFAAPLRIDETPSSSFFFTLFFFSLSSETLLLSLSSFVDASSSKVSWQQSRQCAN